MKLTGPVDPHTFARALAMIRGQSWLEAIGRDMTARTGRPRACSWRALCVVLQIAAFEGYGSLLLTDAERVAHRLTDNQRSRLGLTNSIEYSHLESAVADLAAAMQERVDTETGEIIPSRLSLTLPELMTQMVSGFIPDRIPVTSTQSIDSTDYETHRRRRSWRHHMKPDVAADSLPEDDFVATKTEVNENGWPKIGADGRLQHTVDPDARDGYVAGKNMTRKSVFCGWDLHTSVDTPDLGADARPPLIRGTALVPAGSKKGEPGLAIIDALITAGHTPTTVLVDRGYTYLKADSWARPLDQRKVTQVFDLHPTQRGMRPGPIPGTIYLDGGLFSEALPEHLRNLPGYSLGQSAEEKAHLAAQYDKRAPYAFSTQGKPDHRRGTQRYRGPALAGRVRCPNTPRSMRLDPSTRPTTTCDTLQPCACEVTVTLGPDDYLQTRQRDLYGTTAWKSSYGRRSAAESGNAVLKTHHARLQRGSTRVMGTNRTGILLAFIIAATNASLLLTRYGYDIGNPPEHSDAEITPLPSPRTALHRKRSFKRRRRSSTIPPSRPPNRPSHTPNTWLSPTQTTTND